MMTNVFLRSQLRLSSLGFASDTVSKFSSITRNNQISFISKRKLPQWILPKKYSTSSSRDWIRPLTTREIRQQENNELGRGCVSLTVRLSSARPITAEDCRRAFVSAFRKIPNLRLRVGEKDGIRWWRNMEKEKIDFEVIENADVLEECYKLSTMIVDHSEGPLWKGRFLPWSPKQNSYLKSTSAPDEKTKYPHVCHFIVSIYHSCTDGFSGIHFMNTIASCLDDALSGNPTDDEKQEAVFLDPKNVRSEVEKAKENFKGNPEGLNKKMEYLKSCMIQPDFLRAFAVEPVEKPTTLVISHMADLETSQIFISRCKQERVTVHAGLCSVIEATAVKLMLERGLTNQKSFKIPSAHTVNARAYYKSKEIEVGYGVQHYHMLNEVPANILSDFWNFARLFNQKFREDTVNKMSVQEDAIQELTGFSCVKLLGQPDYLNKMKYYTTANVGDVTSFLGHHKHIQVEYFIPVSQQYMSNFLFLNASHTIRGRFANSFFYHTHLMEAETAKLFSDTIFETIANVSKI